MTPLAPLDPMLAAAPGKPTPTENPSLARPANEEERGSAKPRSSRYQSLDLWRGAACLMLVVYHASFFVSTELRLWDLSAWTSGDAAIKAAQLMWIGVPLFFVVSGFCIAA